jgi:hypothetical protein
MHTVHKMHNGKRQNPAASDYLAVTWVEKRLEFFCCIMHA